MASRTGTRAVYGKRTVASKPAPAPQVDDRADATISPASRALSPATVASGRPARGRSVTPQRRKAAESPRSPSPVKRRRLDESEAGSPASDAPTPPAAASPPKPKLLSRMQPRRTASTPSPVKAEAPTVAEASPSRARAVTPPPNRALGRSASFPSPGTLSPSRTLQRTGTAPTGLVATPSAEPLQPAVGSGRASGAPLRTYGRSGTASASAPTRIARALAYEEPSAATAVPGLGLAAKMRESYADMRKRWGVDLDEEDDATSPADDANASPTAHALSTIVQMRTHGGSRKFADDLGYLLDGLEATEPLGVRRTRCAWTLRDLS